MDDLLNKFNERAGARIKRFRKAAGMSQGELVARVRGRGLLIRQTQMSRIEHGERPISLEEAVVFSRVLGVDVASLLNDTDDTEMSAIQAQQDEALAEISARRGQVTGHQEEITELQRQIAYYEIVVHHCEQRMADLNDAHDEDNDVDDGYEEI